MSYDEFLSRRDWLMATYHLTRDEATETTYYDTDPQTWAGSPWGAA
jgi:hypothetical protein